MYPRLSRLEIGFCALFIAFSLFVSCDTGSNPDSSPSSTKTPAITSVSWEVLNRDPSHSASAEMYISAIGTYNEDVTESDIVSFKLIGPDKDTWSYPKSEASAHINAPKRTFEARNCYDQDHPQSIALGTYTLSLTLSGGKTITKDFYVNEPNTTDTSAKTYVTSKTTLGATEASALKRPTILSHAKTNTSITLSINPNDSRVRNGRFYFYNASGTYIGSSKDPFYELNGTPASFVTVTGTYLNCTLNSSQVSLQSGWTFADIAKVAAVTVDGKQYPGTNIYDYISMGIKTAL